MRPGSSTSLTGRGCTALAPWIDDASIARPASAARPARLRRVAGRRFAAELLQTLLDTSVISVLPSSQGFPGPLAKAKANLRARCFQTMSPNGLFGFTRFRAGRGWDIAPAQI